MKIFSKLRRRWFPTLEERSMQLLENYQPCTTRFSDMYDYERWLLSNGYLKTREARNGGIWLERVT